MMSYKLKLDPFPVMMKLQFKDSLIDENALGTTDIENDVVTVKVCIADKDKVVPTIIHESVHVMQFLQQFIDSIFDIETQAYMVERIACWSIERYYTFSSKYFHEKQKLCRQQRALG